MVAVLLCSVSANAHDFKVGGIYYNITSSTDLMVEVTYGGSSSSAYTNEYTGFVTIPESVTYNGTTYSVTSIGYQAFCYCSGLTSVTIPNSVTSIGDAAFSGCSLTEVHISDIAAWCNIWFSSYSSNPLYYAGHLFLGNEEVKNLVIPEGVTAIRANAFYKCSGLTSVTIPNSVTSIGESAFYDCSGLTSVTIGNSVTSIGKWAFCDCSGLSSVTIPNSVTSIGIRAFDNTAWYKNFPYGVVYINDVLYEYKGTMPSGTSIDIKDGTVSISASAFCDCSGLTSVTIPNSVTSIGSYAFYGCDSLASMTIGAGVLSIVSDQCTPKKVVWLTNTTPSGYENLEGTVNYVANNQYKELSNVEVYPYLSSMFETGGVKYVPVSPAERTCDAIDCTYDNTATDINIGETVSFKGVVMTVKEVNPYTLYRNKHIKNVKILHKGNVGDYAFYGCTGITDATMSNEGNIGASAFEGAMTSGNAVLKVSNKGNVGNKAFYGCTSLKIATLGDKISSLGNYAFCGCSSLQEIAIPNSVTSVGNNAFSGCSSMKSVKMGTGVTNIDEYAFQICSALTDMNIGSNVKTIGNYVFSGCAALPEIVIPQATTSIGNHAFSGCSSLADVIIKDRAEALNLGSNGSSPLFASCPLDSVYIGGKITYRTSSNYGYSPFYRNTSLRTVVITDKETEVYANEFYGCTNLKNVSIGNGVTAIGNYAFSGCCNLDGFSFGKSMVAIGEEAFSDCTNLTQLISHATAPPTCGTQALDDINKWNCTLKIPEGSLSAYQAAEQWKEFFFIENIPAAINGVVVDGEDADKNAPVYNLQGVKMQNVDNFPAGIYVKNGKKYMIK